MPFAGNPDVAWKALLLVVDWIKHAEVKAAGSIAAAGVLAGLLYNLVKGESRPGGFLATVAVAATVLICLTAVFGALVFWPRFCATERSRRARSSFTTSPGSTAVPPRTSWS